MKGLSEHVIDEIYEKYISGKNIDALILQYELPVLAKDFYRIFPPALDRSSVCQHCAKPMYRLRPSRAASKRTSEYERVCMCGHEEHAHRKDTNYKKMCICHGCLKEESAARLAEEKRRQAAGNALRADIARSNGQIAPVSLHSLSLREIASLMALISCRAKEDLSTIFPMAPDLGRGQYCPTQSYAMELVDGLYKKGILVVDPINTPILAFTGQKSPLDKAYWLLNAHVSDGERLTLGQTLKWLTELFSKGAWNTRWTVDILDLWMDIAVEECVQFLQARIDITRHLQFPAQLKTRALFRKLLKDYSVSEIYCLCYMAQEGASAFLGHKRCEGQEHASNSIPWRLSTLAEKYSSGRKLTPFNRDPNIPRSALSRTLFDTILGTKNDTGFNHCPDQYWHSILRHESRYSHTTEDVTTGAGKHYVACSACGSPDVNVRFGADCDRLVIACPDCGSRSWYANEDAHPPSR